MEHINKREINHHMILLEVVIRECIVNRPSFPSINFMNSAYVHIGIIKKALSNPISGIDQEKIKAFDLIQKSWREDFTPLQLSLDVDNIMEVSNEIIVELLKEMK